MQFENIFVRIRAFSFVLAVSADTIENDREFCIALICHDAVVSSFSKTSVFDQAWSYTCRQVVPKLYQNCLPPVY